MKQTVEKIKTAIEALEKEHSSLLTICALILRADPLEKWDVIVSASWLNPKEMQSYSVVSSKVRSVLDSSEVVQFSRIVILDQKGPVISYLQSLQTITNGGVVELNVNDLSEKFKFSIKKAYLLRSQKLVI